MSRSGSRYPSAFGHTPSYRSYVKGDMVSQPIGYNVSLPGVGGSGGSLGGRPGYSGVQVWGGDLGGFEGYAKGLGPTNYSSSNSQVMQKNSVSNYSSVSDSNVAGGRPHVQSSYDATLR